jgi:outer membrane protein assembly factor BamB
MAYPGAVVAVSLATGKELWRGPDPVVDASVAVNAGLAYIMGKDGTFYALDAATGRERWKAALAKRGGCVSRPVVRDDTIYFTGHADATPGDATKPAGDYLFALDANTGQERWRYRPVAPDAPLHDVCLSQPVVSADAVFATADVYLYAVIRATGKEHWKPLEIRRPVEGRERGVEVHGLVDVDSALVGMTSGFLIAFDKTTGKTVWEVPGHYNAEASSIAVAGRVLYFQGSPDARPARLERGTLNALDLDTRAILWSFTRPTHEPNWAFGHVTPFDGGLWVDSYQALVKLQ